MAPAPTPPPPGNMTVPPTFGWEDIATVLVLLSVVALIFLVIGAAAASFTGRSEWQGYLGERSSRRRVVPGAPGPEDDAASTHV